MFSDKMGPSLAEGSDFFAVGENFQSIKKRSLSLYNVLAFTLAYS